MEAGSAWDGSPQPTRLRATRVNADARRRGSFMDVDLLLQETIGRTRVRLEPRARESDRAPPRYGNATLHGQLPVESEVTPLRRLPM